MTEETERRIGPYELIRTIGRGGSSTVYEAVDNRDGRLVALKVVTIPSDLQEEDTLTRRMERSSRAVASLSHPNVAHVYETGEAPFSDARPDAPHTRYIAMERVDGITLRERLKREGGPLPLPVAADILTQTASGLDAVHAAEVMHRDIKPSNILIATDGTVKLTDFGIARRSSDTMITLEGVMIGSPHYISPEQTTNNPATTASDIWALGVVLYEMVVGRVPFAGENIPATLYQIAHGNLPAVPVTLPNSVRDVLNRALERDPASRYPTATSMAEAFRHAIDPAVQANVVPAAALPAPTPAATAPVRERARKRPAFVPLAIAAIGGVALVAGGFLAAPRFTTTVEDTTSVATGLERPSVTPSVPAPVRPVQRPSAGTAKNSRVASAAKPSQKSGTPAVPAAVPSLETAAVPSPASPDSSSPVTAVPSSPVIVAERTPETVITPQPTPAAAARSERRSDMPPAITPPRPPLEVSRDLPPIDLVPLPKATPRATPEPTPIPETPSPTPSPAPTPSPEPTPRLAPPPGPRTREAAASDEEGIEAEDPNTRLTGTWRGTHTGHSAQLVVRELNRDNGEFRGTLTVQMPSGPVRIAVSGQVFDDGGITIRETRVVRASVERAWDLGVNTGTFDPDDLTLSGRGRDKRGRTYEWSFRR
ncbi:MAG: protein kinase [Armatimonadota bacterium]